MSKAFIDQRQIRLGAECSKCGEIELFCDADTEDVGDACDVGESQGWLECATFDGVVDDGPICPNCAKDCEEYWREPTKKDLVDGHAYMLGEYKDSTEIHWGPCAIYAVASKGEVDLPYMIRVLIDGKPVHGTFLVAQARVKA